MTSAVCVLCVWVLVLVLGVAIYQLADEKGGRRGGDVDEESFRLREAGENWGRFVEYKRDHKP